MKDFNQAGVKLLLGFALIALGVSVTGNSWADPISGLVKNNMDGSQILIGHVPMEVRNSTAKFLHHADTSQNISARIILPLQNQTQLTALINDLYDPKSPNFHNFITPTQFAQQFTPSTIDSTLVQEYLKNAGFTVAGQSANGAVLKVTGSVSAIEQAFGLHINYYQKTDGTSFFAPDSDPTIPSTMAGKILAIGGLDNLAKYQPHSHQIPLNTALAAGAGGNLAPKSIAGTGPQGYLAPKDVKTAYNLNSVPATGTGQTLALFELDTYTPSDITTYDAQFGLTGVPLQNVLVDGFDQAPGAGSSEVTLDIELMSAFAPGSSNILVYEALNTTQGWVDEWSQIASDNKAKIISCSWGMAEMYSPTLTFDYEIFQQMAAQGQAVFVAAGDSGAYEASAGLLSVDEPASLPFSTAVGISALSINSNGTYNNETASIYGGGGISADWSIPGYQTTLVSQANSAAHVSNTMRNVPDLALTADLSTCYAFYINGSWGGWYGSSIAAPIWASFFSLVNQGLGTNGPLGFANPLLYQLAQSSSYANDFHDVTSGNNGDGTGPGYLAEPGFDDATGLGSFNGFNLYNDIINTISSANPLNPPSIPVGLNANAGNASVVLTWSSSSGTNSYNIERATVNGGPYTVIGSSKTAYYIDNTVADSTTYYYVVSAVNSKGQSANSAQVIATPVLNLPSAPVGLQASAQSASVALSWDVNPGAISFNIKRATVSGGPYTTIGSSMASNTLNSYVDNSALNSTTYYYVVSAVNGAYQSANSQQVNAEPLAIYSKLNPNLLVTATANSSQVTLSWNAVNTAQIYNISRATASGGPYTSLNNTSSTSYIDKSLVNGKTYYYVVTAQLSLGVVRSVQVSATPQLISLTGTPNPCTAMSGSLCTATINWQSSILTQVWLQMDQNPLQLFTCGAGGTAQASWIQPGHTYTFTLYNATSCSASGQTGTALQSVVVQGSFLAPPAPAGLTVTSGNALASLTWTAAPGAISYTVLRSTISGNSYVVVARGVTKTFYNDTSVSNGSVYYYVVSAQNTGGMSAISAQVSATPMLPPAAPVGLKATAGNAQVILNWSASSGATSYGVARTTVNGATYILVSAVTGTTYTDTWNLTNGTTYYYYIWANYPGGITSLQSAQVSVMPMAPPPAPVGLTVSSMGSGFVGLSWTSNPGVVTSYLIQRATVSGGPYSTITNTVGGYIENPSCNFKTCTYTDYSVSTGTTYYYIVLAVNSAGDSVNSSQVSATPQLPPPAPVNVTAISGNSQVELTWSATSGAASYQIVQLITSNSSDVLANSVTSTSYTVSSLTNGTAYNFCVEAVSANGEVGPCSAQVSATPET